MTYMKLGNVLPFPNAKPDKPQALKVLEEASETVEASCNLAAAMGVEDLTPYLARCEERNRRRGRYDE